MENIPRMELIQVAENVAREKLIEKEDVILAMEDAIQKAARSKYGLERDIRANINRNNGAISIEQFTQVVDDVVDEATQMSLSEAQRRDTSLKVGDFYKKVLPPFDFGRIAAQSAKQVISQKVRDAERLRQFNQFKDRVGEIILGTVKRFDNFSVTLDIGKAEGVIRKDEMIPREQLKPGDRVRTYILNVSEEIRGPQIFLSRSSNEFLRLLFTQEVPEIYDGIIEIKSSARDPGSRAKICVKAIDTSLDPVGACVGMRGSRVQAVSNELGNERIDIVVWDDDPAKLLINTLSPAEVTSIVMDDDSGIMEVIVKDENLALAIGRNGQNIRLSSELVGWEIQISGENDNLDVKDSPENALIKYMGVDQDLAKKLIENGFDSVQKISQAEAESLEKIEELDIEISETLIERAEEALLEIALAEMDEESIEVEKDNTLESVESLKSEYIELLKTAGIKTKENLADLSSDELSPILDLNEDEAGKRASYKAAIMSLTFLIKSTIIKQWFSLTLTNPPLTK